ncbi:MAG: hypothetical protein HOE48_18335 [Candidatus Latescibacteria bacterium]|nr:hypothetical protein [Candidatus Latescibacterota bacterium]
MTAGVDLESFKPLRTIQVKNIEELMDAVAAAQKGDLIEVADGDYNNTKVIRVDTKKGTAQAPILIRAANRGNARILGSEGFLLQNCAYVAIEGFSFFSNDIVMACRVTSSHHCRFTRNHIRGQGLVASGQEQQRSNWVRIGGEKSHHNRIDHNLFEEKRSHGVMISTAGSSVETGNMSTQYDRIDRNHFRNFYPGTKNGYETIRLGSSTYSHSSAHIIVDHNLFERCDGEAEIISVKSNDNTLRHNTFRNSRGMLTLRNCHTCLVEGNFFFNDSDQKRSSGIRFFGQGHVIINNYFQDLGETAIFIKTGDIERRTDPRWKYQERDGDLRNWGGYQRPEDALVAFNTIVNCAVAFRLGEQGTRAETYSLPARNITIANNLIVSNREKINEDLGMWEQFTIADNIFYSSHPGAELGWALPQDGYRMVDPKLAKQGGFLRLTTQSPAVDAALGDYPAVVQDIKGQWREGQKDIGADELTPLSIQYVPLTSSAVGPQAK